MSTNLSIWRDTPAQQFTDALPLGNGRMGAMVYGRIQHEIIQLNDDTLWSGVPRTFTFPQASEIIPKIRQAICQRHDLKKAERLCRKLQGHDTETALPMGTLHLDFKETPDIKNYRHVLSLSEAQTTTTCILNGHPFKREVFCSYPDQVMVVRIMGDGQPLPDFTVSLHSELHHQIQLVRKSITMTGQAPSQVDDQGQSRWDSANAMTFATALSISHNGGDVTVDGPALAVSQAHSVTLLLTTATSFNGYAKHPVSNGKAAQKLAETTLTKARRKTFDDLLSRHRADFMPLYSACTLELESSEEEEQLPTPQRLSLLKRSHSPAMAALLFNYGRYLLLACSRAASQPATTQGGWQAPFTPPSPVNCPLDSSLEMIYWPVGPANLLDCNEPLFKLLDELRKTGALVASVNYNCRGWCTHQSTDIWRQPCPSGNLGARSPKDVNSPLGGIWLTLNLWEYCDFTADPDFLRRKAWPIMKGAAQFALDWLTPQNRDGEEVLVTVPSFSPGKSFITSQGTEAEVHIASTSDLSLIKELFNNCLVTAKILNLGRDPVIREIRKTMPQLLPFPVNEAGRLQEWEENLEPTTDSNARLEHCLSCYPGKLISLQETPELSKAVNKSLEAEQPQKSGALHTIAWELCLKARLQQGNQAWRLLLSMLKPAHVGSAHHVASGLAENLFLIHPYLNLAANLGITAAMAEMLIQSHRLAEAPQQSAPLHVMILLPALPDDWSQGHVSGLGARGGFRVDLTWQQNKLVKALVKPTVSTCCLIDTKHPLQVTAGRHPVETMDHHGFLAFNVTAGREYTLTPEHSSILTL